MQSSFLLQLLRLLAPNDLPRLRKFLLSPYFNHRPEILRLYECLLKYRRNDFAGLEKEGLFAQLFPGERFDNRRLNHLLSDLTALTERFFALEEILSDEALVRLRQCRALRKRGAGQLFERDISLQERRHRES